MRVSQHSGREGNAKHNDRSFLQGLTQEEQRAKAPHIDSTKTEGNIYRTLNRQGQDFRESELIYYESHYGAAIEATNSRYRAEGHPERCRTVEQVYTGKLTRPEEMIIQIGNIENGITAEGFKDCLRDYLAWLNAWNRDHGGHMKIISLAVHTDEASPHAHIRRVWDYTDKDGNLRLGQNKALEAAGVALPDPRKPAGRYNNRKMTFDAMAREALQNIAKAHGYQIETEPKPNARHKSKADYIAGQLQGKIDSLERRAGEAARTYREALETARDLDSIPLPATTKKGIGRQRREVVEMNPEEYERIMQAARAMNRHAEELRRGKEAAEQAAEEEKRKKAALENAVKEVCTAEEQAKIWLIAHGERPDPEEQRKAEPEKQGRQIRKPGHTR